jgi:hypothetical protein
MIATFDTETQALASEQLELTPQGAAMSLLDVSDNSFSEFCVWRENPTTREATGRIMEKFYRICARAYARHLKWGVGFSIRLAEEQVRDEIRMGLARGVRLKGYALNSHLTKPLLVHILTEHPEWRPMFEVRRGVKPVYEETVIVKRRRVETN